MAVKWASQLRPAIAALAALTLLTGVVYPMAVTVFAQWVFPVQANGSLVWHGSRLVGSRLIGQEFDSPGYFWGRPSATSPEPPPPDEVPF